MSERSHQSVELRLSPYQNEAITYAIGERLSLLTDTSPSPDPRYAIANHESPCITAIRQACNEVITPGVDNEIVWERTYVKVVQTAIDLLIAYDEEKGRDTDPALTNTLAAAAIHTTIAACSMYVIDRHTGRREASKADPIDALFAVEDMNIDCLVSTALQRIENNGLAVGGVDSVARAADILDGRPAEIEKNTYTHTLWLIHELADSERPDITLQAMNSLVRQFAAIRYAESLGAPEYDALVREIGRSTLLGSHLNAEALSALPVEYLAKLYERNDEVTATLLVILEHCARLWGNAQQKPASALAAAEFFFPGGVRGEIARSHPHMQALVGQLGAGLGSDEALYYTMLPKHTQKLSLAETRGLTADTEAIIARYCDTKFIDKAFARSYSLALLSSLRVRKSDQNTKLYNPDALYHVFTHLSHILATIGEDQFKTIHQRFAIGAIDFYDAENLKVLAGLDANDPQTIRHLQNCDVTLVMFDADGSDNEAIATIVHQLDSQSRHTERLIVPWRQPSDFYRTITLLKKRQVQFCNLVIATHGYPGSLAFNRGEKRFQIISDRSVNTQGLAIEDSQLERIAKEYMCRPKFARQLGTPAIKRIIAAACSSDVPFGNAPSVAESLLHTAGKGAVATIGTQNITTAWGKYIDGKGLFLTGYPLGVPHVDDSGAVAQSNMVQLSHMPEKTSRMPGTIVSRRLINTRVVI